MVESNIITAIASGKVPPSVSVEYLTENRNLPAKVAIMVVGLLTSIVVLLRCSSRCFIMKKFGVDDALATCSLMLHIAFMALCITLINLGTGRHIEYIEYVMTDLQTDKTEILDFTAHLIYTSTLFVCRLSGLAFYGRLCELHDKLSIAIKYTAVFLVAAYLPQMALIIFHCHPVTGLWPYSWQQKSSGFVCLSWGLVYSVNSGLSLVCDMFMFAIPMFLIRALKLPKNRKLRLYLVLLPGVLVIVISIIRLYLVVQGQWITDGPWYYDPMLAIENAEIGGTLIALSIPGLKPLFSTCIAKLDSSLKNIETHLPINSVAGGQWEIKNDRASPVKTTVTISTGGRRPTSNKDYLQETGGEELSYISYEVNIETRDTLDNMSLGSVQKGP